MEAIALRIFSAGKLALKRFVLSSISKTGMTIPVWFFDFRRGILRISVTVLYWLLYWANVLSKAIAAGIVIMKSLK